jgi:hypothetical protein
MPYPLVMKNSIVVIIYSDCAASCSAEADICSATEAFCWLTVSSSHDLVNCCSRLWIGYFPDTRLLCNQETCMGTVSAALMTVAITLSTFSCVEPEPSYEGFDFGTYRLVVEFADTRPKDLLVWVPIFDMVMELIIQG